MIHSVSHLKYLIIIKVVKKINCTLCAQPQLVIFFNEPILTRIESPYSRGYDERPRLAVATPVLRKVRLKSTRYLLSSGCRQVADYSTNAEKLMCTINLSNIK